MSTPAQRRFRDRQLAREVSRGAPRFGAPTMLLAVRVRLGVGQPSAGITRVLTV